ncbi:DNA_pol_A_exo1 domain-containing protein [Cephalotus follicularis]|uniref:DNA_pol_A_exo1 domain-containing protein n=1 Tax=Cephalotus follicularis TaxID=3775 RepID=A0A1Q3CTU7_CEPFO|nr:DNA_pol_A_exo1 domain-containing protein [Cephalotus follicularis]
MSIIEVQIGNISVKTTVITDDITLENSLKELWSNMGRDEFVKNVVGLGLEKRFTSGFNGAISSKVAALVLCAGYQCLIIELNSFQVIPFSLASFLDLSDITFVGVGIKQNVSNLRRDYGLECRNAVELGPLAAVVREKHYLSACGLPDIASACGVEVCKKSADVALGNWGARKLRQECIRYATYDAYASFLVGNRLLQGIFPPLEDYLFD